MSSVSRPVTDLLRIDPAAEVDRIVKSIRDLVFGRFRRKGAIVGVSGGIDSSVVAALCVEAFGKDRVVALFLPESE
jgi:NAD+ synthase